jgi:hypothetical protein
VDAIRRCWPAGGAAGWASSPPPVRPDNAIGMRTTCVPTRAQPATPRTRCRRPRAPPSTAASRPDQDVAEGRAARSRADVPTRHVKIIAGARW